MSFVSLFTTLYKLYIIFWTGSRLRGKCQIRALNLPNMHCFRMVTLCSTHIYISMTQCTGPIELNTMGQKQDTLNKRMCKGLNSEVNRGEKNLFIVNKNLLRLTLEEGCDRVCFQFGWTLSGSLCPGVWLDLRVLRTIRKARRKLNWITLTYANICKLVGGSAQEGRGQEQGE